MPEDSNLYLALLIKGLVGVIVACYLDRKRRRDWTDFDRLRKSEKTQNLLVQEAAAPIFVINQNKRIITLNVAARELLTKNNQPVVRNANLIHIIDDSEHDKFDQMMNNCIMQKQASMRVHLKELLEDHHNSDALKRQDSLNLSRMATIFNLRN